LRDLNEIKKSGYKDRVAQARLVNRVVERVKLLGGSMIKLPSLDLSVVKQMCEKAHHGRRCSTAEELEYPHNHWIKAVGLACPIHTKAEWTTYSYKCQLKPFIKHSSA
jgi:hypothetical protein